MKLFDPPCRNTEICPPWKSCLECEWRACVSSTDALVIIIIMCLTHYAHYDRRWLVGCRWSRSWIVAERRAEAGLFYHWTLIVNRPGYTQKFNSTFFNAVTWRYHISRRHFWTTLLSLIKLYTSNLVHSRITASIIQWKINCATAHFLKLETNPLLLLPTETNRFSQCFSSSVSDMTCDTVGKN